jgi:hypothetical protein
MANRIWVVINKDNRTDSWMEDWQTKTRRAFPQPDDYGLLWLDGYPYVPNPNVATKEDIRPPIFKVGIIGLLIGIGIAAYPDGLLYGGPLIFASILGIIAGFRYVTWETYTWRKNEPAQINMNDPALTPDSIGITGDTIRKYAKSQHLERLTQNDTNWWPVIVIAIAILAVVAVAAVYYR